MWIWSSSFPLPPAVSYCLCRPFLWWCEMIKCLQIACLGDPGSSNHVDVSEVGCQEQAVLMAGGSGWDGAGRREGFLMPLRNGVQFKTYRLCISGLFHLVFSDWGWLRVTQPTESKTESGDLHNYWKICGFFFFFLSRLVIRI